MPRIARLIAKGETTVYHVMSRTALEGFPFKDVENDALVKIIKRFSKLYFTEILGFCAMGNHFHILARMFPEKNYTDEDIKKRVEQFIKEGRKDTDNENDDIVFLDEDIPYYRNKLEDLSQFVKEIKQTFSRFYNKRHGRRGTLWGERFKSLIVENGETLINCLAYIDLNPVRAGLVDRPEDYRWNSLGYHMQTDNKDDFLSLDFGLKEFAPVECASLSLRELHWARVKSEKERVRRYRRYVYETGAVKHPEKGETAVIDEDVLKQERKNNFDVTRMKRFKSRTRYFTDSGIIGSKEFVCHNYLKFKHMFQSKEKKPKPVTGLSGIYSLKRLAET